MRGAGVCPFMFAAHPCSYPMGARSPVSTRNGTALSCRYWCGASHHYHQSIPPRRCVVDPRKQLAMPHTRSGHRRALGRPKRSRFHGYKTARAPLRGIKCAVLADPPCSNPEPECCTRALAHWLGPLCASSSRSTGTRYAALVSRLVSRASRTACQMDGHL